MSAIRVNPELTGSEKKVSPNRAKVMAQGKTYIFDSFECAIHKLAPSCVHCGVRIIGHGLESGGRMFCCDHCATQEGVTELRDRS